MVRGYGGGGVLVVVVVGAAAAEATGDAAVEGGVGLKRELLPSKNQRKER